MSRALQKLTILIVFLSFNFITTASFSQEQGNTKPDGDIDNYREQIRRLIGFLEFSLNTLGDPDATTRDKETIINESYSKAFLHEKVQVEDDLDENREILTYKDVQAYLKDVDFFFKQVEFNFDVQDIQALTNESGMTYFKVTANRNLKGITVDDEAVSNNKTRYVEINLDEDEQVLKIASIYTTRLNEAEELMTWWNGMPPEWKEILGGGYFITGDSIPLNRLDILNDSTVLVISYYPEEVEFESYIRIGTDSLLVIAKDTLMKESYDTTLVEKGQLLPALRNIVKLERLDVKDNKSVSDLYPVDQMSDLKSLNISGTLVHDLFPARNLTRLISLDISGTFIDDLSPIRYNTNIRELYLDSTQVTSLEPINSFHALEILHLDGCPIADLGTLKNLPAIRDIDISNTPVIEISPLADLAALGQVKISGTKISDLGALTYMISLKKIYFEGTPISNLEPLAGLDSLQYIYADRSEISDLSPLGGISSLQKIYCDQTKVTKTEANAFMADYPKVLVIYESVGLTAWWSSLDNAWQDIFRGYVILDAKPTREQLHQITLTHTLDIHGNDSISNLEPLSKLSNLHTLYAGRTNISDLKPLAELTELRNLYMPHTSVSDLTPLQSLLLLEEIDLSGTAVTILSGLGSLGKLTTLTLDSTGVASLDALANTPALEVIYADGTGINTTTAGQFLDRYPGCLVVYQSDKLISWWQGLSSTWKSALGKHSPMDESPTREQLHKLASLSSVDISGNRDINTLEPLTVLSRLQEINMANCGLADLRAVAGFPRLKIFNLSGNPIADLSPISKATSLVQLDISNTPVEKLDALASLSSLEQLNCSGTQIKKMDPISGLKNLKKLECQNTSINNLKPLLGLMNLRQLVCYNTKLSEKKVEAFKAENPGVEVVYY